MPLILLQITNPDHRHLFEKQRLPKSPVTNISNGIKRKKQNNKNKLGGSLINHLSWIMNMDLCSDMMIQVMGCDFHGVNGVIMRVGWAKYDNEIPNILNGLNVGMLRRPDADCIFYLLNVFGMRSEIGFHMAWQKCISCIPKAWAMGEWMIKFNGLSRTADSEVNVIHICDVIITRKTIWICLHNKSSSEALTPT